MRSYISAYKLAKMLRVNRSTVARWIENGKIKQAYKIKGRQSWLIPISSYLELIDAKT